MNSYWPIVFNRARHHHKRYRLKKVHDAGAHIIASIHHHLISKALDGTDATETNRRTVIEETRQAGVERVTVHEASGRLITGLDILARAWLWWSNRISEI